MKIMMLYFKMMCHGDERNCRPQRYLHNGRGYRRDEMCYHIRKHYREHYDQHNN